MAEPRIILDTHILVHSLNQPGRLSLDQSRAIGRCESRGEPIALSGMSLLEIAMLAGDGRIKVSLRTPFHPIDTSPVYQILPIATTIAADAVAFLSLRDPAGQVIVATARVHRLTLLTSDQRILDAGLVSTIS